VTSKIDKITAEEWATCVKVLQIACDEPNTVSDMETLTGLVTKLYKSARKQRKQHRQLNNQEQRNNDRAILESSLRCQSEPLDEMNTTAPPLTQPRVTYQQSHKFIRCYICQHKYQDIHFFYHRLCPTCAEYNYAKRQQRTNLKGRIALVTGGRVKVGYATVLKLLRDEARVIMITRFPRDAAQRYAQEADFETWQNNLKIYGLDLRNIPQVEFFLNHLINSEPYLDIIINNAAQTIKRPNDFFAHLMTMESAPTAALPEKIQTLLGNYDNNLPIKSKSEKTILSLNLPINSDFPIGKYDIYGQQLDLRSHNSWTTTLAEVDTIELLEVHLINAIAPFLFNSRLKPLLLKSPYSKRFIINVSSVEGQFSYPNKTLKHPHTNMTKAALNMLTRTSAEDYAQESIFMNSIDPGWISQEGPYHQKTQQRKEGVVPPLDIIDGAARIYDPIVQGMTGTPVYGQFLKNYRSVNW
jgi:NAD(P)-dependent dehydrogenase (short-subunit alcohol dehydrogenase family)